MSHPTTCTQLIANGLAGVGGSCLAVVSTFQEQLEWWVRISGGFLGIVVALITIWRLLFSKNKTP